MESDSAPSASGAAADDNVASTNSAIAGENTEDAPGEAKPRSQSFSQKSDNSQTAAEFLRDQQQLEADAMEALPYSIENCTKPLGALRQSVYACLTCNPPPTNSSDPYDAAGVCYSCSVQCHGEHTLVEIFNKRNFTCDCGTTRFPATAPCTLRINEQTNSKGGVHSETPNTGNEYNQNFRNRFCGCECDYDPYQQKGTMFQCLGLGTHQTGGCGEDWWHPGCVVGLDPDWFEKAQAGKAAADDPKPETTEGALPTISEDAEAPTNGDAALGNNGGEADDDDAPPPPGFPAEDAFEGFICYKCVEAFPWIRQYAGAPGFLLPVQLKRDGVIEPLPGSEPQESHEPRKRKAEDDGPDSQDSKRQKSEIDLSEVPAANGDAVAATKEDETPAALTCKLDSLPPAPEGRFSLFFKDSFRENLCRCPSCFLLLQSHPQLLEEEETYEPPISDKGSTHGSSLLERGESALRNVDRVRAIEGVMAFNQLKDKLKPFFRQFAESGEAISAEDIKEYFAKLRGDEQAIKDAGEAAKSNDFRQEQSGY